MNEEEQQKKSTLYFIYLRICGDYNPKSFDEITVEEMQIEIVNCKKLQFLEKYDLPKSED